MRFSKINLTQLLEVYSAAAALIDEDGTILAVNRAWKEFGCRDSSNYLRSCERLNYLKECERAGESGVRGAATVCAGIRNVLTGTAEKFSYSYDFRSTTTNQRFRLVAAPFSLLRNRRWAVVLHENITHQRGLALRYIRLKKRQAEFLSVCAWCKLIREGPDTWVSFEKHFSRVHGIQFSHAICPECLAAFALESLPGTVAGVQPVCKRRR
jgi:hypothetical protein